MDRVQTLAGKPGRLLDMGCGTGTFLHLARERGWDVAGTELSPDGAKAAAASGLQVFTGEVWEAGFPPETFDVVTCWHVIEHVSDPRRVVEEFFRILRPGGRCMLATPNLDDRIFRVAYLLARGRRPLLYQADEREVHLYFFSARTLRALVASTGFTEVAIGFDRGAAAERGKWLVNELGYLWFRFTSLNWGMALELIARKPPTSHGRVDG
jgi:2-polyprenyl-3-methyl-5-hydroxy-6-metoxy-1,4-benzoquinol methylase